MRQYELPCMHYIATMIAFKSLDKLRDTGDTWYFIESYVKGRGCGTDTVHDGVEIPLESELTPQNVKFSNQ